MNAVAPARGWRWIAEGWALFRRAPLVWVVLTACLIFIWLVLLSVPKVGPLLFNLLFPVFFAGLMLGCRAIESGRKLEIGYLFAGFRENAGALVTVGGVYLIGMLIVMAVVFGASGGLPKLPAKPSPDEIAEFRTALGRMTGPLLAGLALYIPLMMLTWFAPLLIVFRKLNAFPALLASFAACVHNFGAFFVYGCVIVALWIGATLLVLIGLLVVLPIIFGSIYASYRDIFENAEEPAASG